MKRIFILGTLAVGALVIAALAALFYLGPIIKSGIERIGPQITKVPVTLQGATVSVLNGNGELKGFVLGNPEGFKTPEAVKVGSIAISVVPKSVMEKKVIVRSVRIEAPEITYEAGFGGSNIGKVLDNIKAVASQEQKAGTNSPGKVLQVDEFLITGAKLNVSATMLGGSAATLPLPEIRLVKLGQEPEGLTPAELSSKVFSAIVEAAAKVVTGNALNIGKAATEAAQSLSTDAKDRAKKLGSGVSDFFKSKKD